MRVIECSMCRRRAAWLIEKELFCERHKEVVAHEAGIDRFSIRRLTNAERAFRSGGRYSNFATRKKGANKRDGQSHSNSL